jgi:hypothetical protein
MAPTMGSTWETRTSPLSHVYAERGAKDDVRIIALGEGKDPSLQYIQ